MARSGSNARECGWQDNLKLRATVASRCRSLGPRKTTRGDHHPATSNLRKPDVHCNSRRWQQRVMPHCVPMTAKERIANIRRSCRKSTAVSTWYQMSAKRAIPTPIRTADLAVAPTFRAWGRANEIASRHRIPARAGQPTSVALRCNTGFLHFTPTVTHFVLPHWRPAAPSRSLAL